MTAPTGLVRDPAPAEPATATGMLAAFRSTLDRSPLAKTCTSMFDQALVSGTSFVTSILLGRYCSKSELGVYYLALTIVLIMRGVQAELVTAPFTIYSQGLPASQKRDYSGSIIFHQLLILLASSLLFAGAAATLHWGVGPANLAPAFAVLIVFGPCLLMREFVRQLGFARLDPATVTVVDFLATALQLAGLAFLLVQKRLGAVEIFVLLGAANFAVSLMWWIAARPTFRFSPARFGSDWKQNWGFAKWALASQVVCSCTPFLLPWILAFVHGEEEAGVAAASSTLVGLSYVFTTAVANLLTPRAARAFAQSGSTALKRVLRNTTGLFLGVLGAFTLLVFWVGESLVCFVYGDAFAGTGLICFVFALGVLLNSLSIVAGNGLWAINRPQANLTADTITLAVTLLAALSLTPSLGVMGAAIANLTGCGVGACVRLFSLRTELAAIEGGRQAS